MKNGQTKRKHPQTADVINPSALEGYRPFPHCLRTKDHIAPGGAEDRTPKRRAVLVIHGIGAQKPYETLDQFARGLLGYYRDERSDGSPDPARESDPTSSDESFPNQEILLRQHKANPNTNEQDWTQALVRIRPYAHPEDVIDVYEYYWAPVITGKVSALQSLKFLIFAALSPFQYLRDNLIEINRAEKDALGNKKLLWVAGSFIRELVRMLFIFIPVIALSLAFYWLLASSIAKPNQVEKFGNLFTGHVTKWELLQLGTFSIRVLLVGMCVIFLLQEIAARMEQKTIAARGGPIPEASPHSYLAFILALLGILLFVPYWLQAPVHAFLNLSLAQRIDWAGIAILILIVALALFSSIFRAACRRGWNRVKQLRAHPIGALVGLVLASGIVIASRMPGAAHRWNTFIEHLALPGFIHWQGVAFYTLLALLAFAAQRVLTTAIGCLAVYLGSDALDKNFVARSQILHECTTALVTLLQGGTETEIAAEPARSGRSARLKNDWSYDEVLIAGHSLGSVIAYDCLTELIVQKMASSTGLKAVPLEKIRGLLTFGCPLNKVVYFFRTRVNSRTNVLTQILYILHPFRLRSKLPDAANPARPLHFPLPRHLPFSKHFKWLNAYSPFDIISGRMLFYRANLDVAVERGIAPWTAHLSYWENDDLYSLFSQLLKDPAPSVIEENTTAVSGDARTDEEMVGSPCEKSDAD